ncbi:hypothetical protein [Paenibacillus sp. WC2504]
MEPLTKELKLALDNIDFINRFRNLSLKYKYDPNESFENYNNNDVRE